MNFDLLSFVICIGFGLNNEIGIELHDPDFCNTTDMLMRSLDKCATSLLIVSTNV